MLSPGKERMSCTDDKTIDKVIRFNKALKCMIRDLISTYPEYSEFNVCLLMYKIVKTFNKKLPSRFFKQTFSDMYRDQILQRDDSFFSLELFENSDLPINVKVMLNKLQNLQNIWSNMDDDNKVILWDHLNVLLKLSDEIDTPIY